MSLAELFIAKPHPETPFEAWANNHPSPVVRFLLGKPAPRQVKPRKEQASCSHRWQDMEERLETLRAEIYEFMEVYNHGVGTVDSNQAENLAELNALTQAVVELKANYQVLATEVFKARG